VKRTRAHASLRSAPYSHGQLALDTLGRTINMRERFREPLINPTWEQVVEREPLMAFSHYLSGRINVLLDLADEILENLDQGFSPAFVDYRRVARAESLMWLWICGAYEVVRTMCQAKGCFSDRALQIETCW